MKPEKKKTSLRQVFLGLLLGIVLGLAGVAVGALIGGGDVMPEDGNGVLLLLMLPVLIFISLAWHEAGHLLAGRLVDMRPTLFIVGPLQIRWSDDDASVGVNRMAALCGGLAAAAPRTTQRLRQRMMVLVVGGPAATILLALLANGVGGALRDTAPNAEWLREVANRPVPEQTRTDH